jgi:CRP-like cAMP-binding protein
VVLRGAFTVSTQDGVVGTAGQGELLGEISFVDGHLPTATVTASEDSAVLAIPRARLRSKLKTDTTFASHFYLAVGKMLAHRLRDFLAPKGSTSQRKLDDYLEESSEFDEETLDKISLAGLRFETLLEWANR